MFKINLESSIVCFGTASVVRLSRLPWLSASLVSETLWDVWLRLATLKLPHKSQLRNCCNFQKLQLSLSCLATSPRVGRKWVATFKSCSVLKLSPNYKVVELGPTFKSCCQENVATFESCRFPAKHPLCLAHVDHATAVLNGRCS